MTPKEKALQLITMFKRHVNPYSGSGMLSNTYDDNAALAQAKACALITADQVLNTRSFDALGMKAAILDDQRFWTEVKLEITKL